MHLEESSHRVKSLFWIQALSDVERPLRQRRWSAIVVKLAEHAIFSLGPPALTRGDFHLERVEVFGHRLFGTVGSIKYFLTALNSRRESIDSSTRTHCVLRAPAVNPTDGRPPPTLSALSAALR